MVEDCHAGQNLQAHHGRTLALDGLLPGRFCSSYFSKSPIDTENANRLLKAGRQFINPSARSTVEITAHIPVHCLLIALLLLKAVTEGPRRLSARWIPRPLTSIIYLQVVWPKPLISDETKHHHSKHRG